MRRNPIKKNVYYKISLIFFIWIFLFSAIPGLGTFTPVHYWSMDQLFGTHIGQPALTLTDCIQGGCINFDGSSGIRAGRGEYVLSAIQNQATYNFWIQTSSDINQLQYVLTQNQNIPVLNETIMARGAYIQNDNIYFFTTAGDRTIQVVGNYRIEPNTWYFFTLTEDVSTINVYLNGNMFNYTTIYHSIQRYTDFWGIGCLTYSNSNMFKGKLDEISVYSTVLTANEISQVYNMPFATSTSLSSDTATSTNQSIIINNTPNFDVKNFIDSSLVLLIIGVSVYTLHYKKKLNLHDLKKYFGSKQNAVSSRSSTNRSSIAPGSYSNSEIGVRNSFANSTNANLNKINNLCVSCGKPYQKGEIFCFNCGERL